MEKSETEVLASVKKEYAAEQSEPYIALPSLLRTGIIENKGDSHISSVFETSFTQQPRNSKNSHTFTQLEKKIQISELKNTKSSTKEASLQDFFRVSNEVCWAPF